MPEETKEPRCDVDDIICQLEILRDLKSLERNLSSESILPGWQEMAKQIPEEIRKHQGSLKEALEKCGNLSEEDVPPIEERETPLLPEELE